MKADANGFILFKTIILYSSAYPGTGYVVQAGLKLAAILPQPLEYRDYKCVVLCLAKAIV